MRAKLSAYGLVTFACLVLAAPAHADRKDGDRERDDEKSERVYEMREKGEILPLAQILAEVRKSHPGKLLKTEFGEVDGIVIYEFYILQQGGHVVEVGYDARTGRKLSEKKED
ncbi:MAG: peptidase [Notoacmeibacter sp.]|nr:peptidase [Notoacmeibacter sp.]MCC0032203.1 peptidase [Brucellaceae bacterium]